MLPLSLLTVTAAALSAHNAHARVIESSSLVPCMKNSSFFASLFRVAFTPDNQTLTYEINGDSQVSSYVVLDLQVSGYGYDVVRRSLDPCKDSDLKGLCPMTSGPMENMKSNLILSKETVKQVPSAIYYIPDLDGKVRVWINSTEDKRPLACVEAQISNGKTVNQKAIAWTLAIITGMCLMISGIMSGFGHFTTSAHVSARALAVMNYFQSQALIGMTSVTMPPIVRAWTQDFQWSMGIVKAQFHQVFATWYQRATGGRPARLFHSLLTTSVHLQKRTNVKGANSHMTIQTLKGMERVSFLAHIEITNTFFTGYTFFVIVLVVVVLSVAAFKGVCELLVRARKMDPSRFQDFRNGWKLILKGILLRLILIGCLPMIVLCLWELTRRDSVAEVILAVWMLLFIVILLSIATVKITKITRRSVELHRSPAYILYSDPMVLNKWGFLYVQYKATMTWFLSVVLIHSLIRGMCVALAQKSGTTQAISLLVLDLGFLIAVCVVKPYMDKTTNAFNISIASINFFNVLVLLLISGIFGLPPLAIGILGVVYFVVNAIFAGTIVIMTVWMAVRACTTKDPDTHYQAVFDDRVSFVKSQTNLETTELEALGKTARGESTLSFYSLQHPDSMRFNSSRNGFHADSRFHAPSSTTPAGLGSVDDFERKAPMKAYEAEWRPFTNDPAVNASAIRARNAGNMNAGMYRH